MDYTTQAMDYSDSMHIQNASFVSNNPLPQNNYTSTNRSLQDLYDICKANVPRRCSFMRTQVLMKIEAEREQIFQEPYGWLLLLYVLFAIVGTIANSVTIYIFQTKIKRTPFIDSVKALACFDLAVCAIAMPMWLSDCFFLFGGIPEYLCKAKGFIIQFLVFASTYLLIAITFIRCSLVSSAGQPQGQRRWYLEDVRIKVIGASLLAVCMAIPTPLGKSTYHPIPCGKLHGDWTFPCQIGICRSSYSVISHASLALYGELTTIVILVLFFAITVVYSIILIQTYLLTKSLRLSGSTSSRERVVLFQSKSQSTLFTSFGQTIQTPLPTDVMERDSPCQTPLPHVMPNNGFSQSHSAASKRAAYKAIGQSRSGTSNSSGTGTTAKDSCTMALLTPGTWSPKENSPSSVTSLPQLSEGKTTNRNSTHSNGESQKSNKSGAKTRTSRKPQAKILATLLAVSVCAILSYGFLFAFNLFHPCLSEEAKKTVFCDNKNGGYQNLLYHTYYLAHVINPFIYGLLNNKFKSELIKLLRRQKVGNK